MAQSCYACVRTFTGLWRADIRAQLIGLGFEQGGGHRSPDPPYGPLRLGFYSLTILTSRLHELQQLPWMQRTIAACGAMVKGNAAQQARRPYVGLFMNCRQSMPNTVMLAPLPQTPTDTVISVTTCIWRRIIGNSHSFQHAHSLYRCMCISCQADIEWMKDSVVERRTQSTICSAIAERPRCSVRNSFRQK